MRTSTHYRANGNLFPEIETAKVSRADGAKVVEVRTKQITIPDPQNGLTKFICQEYSVEEAISYGICT